MNKQPNSGDSSFLKAMNKSSLLRLIRRSAPISRAELAKRTKLTRATVSTLVEELIAGHVVVETGIGASSGGRKPMMLEINRTAGYVIGMDLRMTDLLIIVANLHGEVIQKSVHKYSNVTDSSMVLSQMLNLIERLRLNLPASPLGLVGVGIGVPGFVEYPSSRILFVPHFGWKDLEWRQVLESKLGLPVAIDNEANLAALGELEFGTAMRLSNVLYVSIGSGIGAGLILNGEIYRGTFGYAGEVGHTTIEREGRRCPCGNLGCWEMYASEKALAELLHLPYEHGVSEVILRRLEDSDALAVQAIQEVGRSLGLGIGNMIHTFNPQMIVIGNAMGLYRPWLEETVEHSIQTRLPYLQTRAVPVNYSLLGDEASARGAASLVLLGVLE